MGKVIIHATMSLDGFISGPDDDMDWVFKYKDDEMVDKVMKDIGAVILGNRTFEISLKNNSLPYGGMIKVPQFVITNKAQQTRTINGLLFTFVTDGIESAVKKAKAAAGNKNISILGASIDQQFLNAHLADEIVIHLAPILLCEGIRLFDHLNKQRIELERTEVISTGNITSLRFRIVK